jgi:ribose transport system permease protein
MKEHATQPNARERFLDFMSRYGPYVALAVLLLICSASSADFRKPQNLLNILRQISYTGIIALGLTFVIIAGGIDLSVGSLTALAGGLGILAMNRFPGAPGIGLAAAILASCAAGVAGGVINGLIITRGKVAPFIATLGTMAIYRSLTLYIVDAGEFRTANEQYAAFGGGKFLAVPTPVWILFLLTAFFAVLLLKTPFGRHVCAVGSSERVSAYSAINVKRIKFLTYLLAGFTVGMTSVLLGARLNSISSSNAGAGYELDAIAAAIIGGTSLSGGRGTIVGTLLGAIILGIVNNMMVMWEVSPYLHGTVKGVVIIIAVLIQRKRP